MIRRWNLDVLAVILALSVSVLGGLHYTSSHRTAYVRPVLSSSTVDALHWTYGARAVFDLVVDVAYRSAR